MVVLNRLTGAIKYSLTFTNSAVTINPLMISGTIIFDSQYLRFLFTDVEDGFLKLGLVDKIV
jgi:hypothetical protein